MQGPRQAGLPTPAVSAGLGGHLVGPTEGLPRGSGQQDWPLLALSVDQSMLF